jgi:cytochrome c oxidase subunit 2
MTSLLVIIVLVLLAIALWQLTKIFDLTQVGRTVSNSQVANNADNNVQGYLMFGFIACFYVFMIYGLIVWGPLVLDNPASDHGSDVDSLMNITWILIFIVQFITQLLLHYFVFKYRGNKDRKALYFADSNKLELIWSTIPAVVLAVLILYGLYAWTNIMFVNEQEEDVIVVELYAKQFGWEARYSGADNVLGKANVRYIEGINTVGVDMGDPNAQDDKMSSELYLPKGTKVLFKMRSQDVLHSAYMPHFRAQMNCVPGMVTQFAFIPSLTTEEYREIPKIVDKVANINKLRAAKSIKLAADGQVVLDPYEFDFLLLCNKICGASHYNMQMKITVVSPEEYKAWLAEKPTVSQQVKEAAASATDAAAPTMGSDATMVEAPIVVVAD